VAVTTCMFVGGTAEFVFEDFVEGIFHFKLYTNG
jgi:hypothetical protein